MKSDGTDAPSPPTTKVNSIRRIVLRSIVWGSLINVVLVTLVRLLNKSVFEFNRDVLWVTTGIPLAAGCFFVFWSQRKSGAQTNSTPLFFGQIVIAMTLMTIAQLIVLPEFALPALAISGPIPWIESFANFCQQSVGLQISALFYGVLHSLLGAWVVFKILEGALALRPQNRLATVVALALLGQLPVISLQAFDPDTREMLPSWMAGSVLALTLAALWIRATASTIPATEHERERRPVPRH